MGRSYMDTNAKQEFLEHIENKKVIAAIVRNEHYTTDRSVIAKLPLGYFEEQYQEFLNNLNFEYDSSYGSQYLEGIIWYSDGTWSERGEYDGSEWWEHRSLPEIPEDLK